MSRALDPRVESIFERALASAQTQREHLVREACGGDQELERDVLELLAAHAGAGDFLSGPALDTGTEPLEVSGRFRIERHLGSGSMGTVYLAQQLAPVKRKVALKLLRAGLCSDEALQRFETERQMIARMNHAGIARLFDSGTSQDGRPWYAMEYVDGEPITSFCAKRKLSLFARVRLTIAICRAAHHAHQSGVIHRDLKPGNVLVVEEDGTPVPKIIDFGVAKALTPLGGSEFQTVHGDLVGTLEYMSPEQALGAGGGIDVRTDVYAIGAILYELITGDHPLPIRSARAAGLASVLRILREGDPLPPSRRLQHQAEREPERARRGELRALARRVQGDLDWIVLAAVERERARRYAAAADLAADLERFLARLPVSVAPPGRAYRLARFVIRHRVALLVSSAIVGSLVAGMVMAFVQAKEAAVQRDLALKSASQARAALAELALNAGTVVHKTDELLADLAGSTRARLSFALWGLECLERVQERPEAGDSNDYFLGYAKQRLGEVHLSSGNLAEAQAWFDRSLEHRLRDVALQPSAQSRRTLAVGHWKSGDVAMLVGAWIRAEQSYRTALNDLEQLDTEGLLDSEALGIYLGMAHRRLADAQAAAGWDARALASYQLAHGRLALGAAAAREAWPARREQVLALLGGAQLSSSPVQDAERALAEALALLDLEHERTGPSNVWERSQRARVLLARSARGIDRGATDAAIEDARAAIELAAALSSGDRDDMQSLLLLAHAQSELGQALLCAKRPEEAALVLGESLPALERIVRLEPRHAQAQCELALACQRMALALSGHDPELAGPWQTRGREIVDELERGQRLPPRDRARLVYLR